MICLCGSPRNTANPEHCELILFLHPNLLFIFIFSSPKNSTRLSFESPACKGYPLPCLARGLTHSTSTHHLSTTLTSEWEGQKPKRKRHQQVDIESYTKLCYVLSSNGKVRLVRAEWWKCFLVMFGQAETRMAAVRRPRIKAGSGWGWLHVLN